MALNFPTSPAINQEYTNLGTTWRWNGTAWIKLYNTGGVDPAPILQRSINFGISSPSVITTGNKNYIKIDNDIQLVSWSIASLQTGNISVDVRVATSPYNVFNSICDSNYINLVATNYNELNDLSSWSTVNVLANSIILFNVISCDITNFNINLKFNYA